MMKQCWVHLSGWNKRIVTEAIESGVDAIICDPEHVQKIKELGRITVVSEGAGADRNIPNDVLLITIKNKDDEVKAASNLKDRIVAVKSTDWSIIPLENLIASGGDNLFAYVKDLEGAKLASEIMEKGVAGVVLETDDPVEVSKVARFIKEIGSEKFTFSALTVTEVKTIGIGDRVCVDTCCNMNMGEGMLVGNTSSGMFLVHAENIENPYVSPRPFRVNAGAVHAYTRVPDGKTRYLEELKTGDPVLIADYTGKSYTSYVGRSKIEKRPMLVIFAADQDGVEHSVVLQNAETIRLTSSDGKALSVVTLKKGDSVLGFVERGGRHFGMKVEETIREK